MEDVQLSRQPVLKALASSPAAGHDLVSLCAAFGAGESGSVSGERLQEMRQLYVAGMRELMPPEAANATWLVDKVRPACHAL